SACGPGAGRPRPDCRPYRWRWRGPARRRWANPPPGPRTGWPSGAGSPGARCWRRTPTPTGTAPPGLRRRAPTSVFGGFRAQRRTFYPRNPAGRASPRLELGQERRELGLDAGVGGVVRVVVVCVGILRPDPARQVVQLLLAGVVFDIEVVAGADAPVRGHVGGVVGLPLLGIGSPRL